MEFVFVPLYEERIVYARLVKHLGAFILINLYDLSYCNEVRLRILFSEFVGCSGKPTSHCSRVERIQAGGFSFEGSDQSSVRINCNLWKVTEKQKEQTNSFTESDLLFFTS